MQGRIFQLNCSSGGVPKNPVQQAVVVAQGMEGDRQAHPKIHGGPERALCLFSLERILELQQEGHPIYPGSTGENVTISGIAWEEVRLGCLLRLGDEVVVEITSYTVPCHVIRGSFADRNSNRISQKEHPGDARVYAKVVRSGTLRIGQSVQVITEEQPKP
ncbi:MAG: MOSC domain-containing protein [Herpetosiphon sp.]